MLLAQKMCNAFEQKDRGGRSKMKKLAITWIQNDGEDVIRIETTNNGFDKFEIIGLLEDMKAKVVFDRAQEVSKILDKNTKKYKRLNKLQKEVQDDRPRE